jgi:Rps23 Pro-64 3,4-dihydroxylase Tpa1-like proline 4-hydroxylase
MTAKQILDAFSETLMQDERILIPRERELLMSLLQNSRTISSGNPEIQSVVTTAIARAVGETVAQRAFTLLGSSIVDQILAPEAISSGAEEITSIMPAQLRTPQPPSGTPQPPSGTPQPPSGTPQPPSGTPQPPSGTPQPPSTAPHPHPPSRTPQPPSGTPQPPSRTPQPPSGTPQPPSGTPQPPSGARPFGLPVQQEAQPSHLDRGSSVAVLDPPKVARAQCVVLDEFLAPQELDELISYALQHEMEFQSSEVISPSGEPGTLDYDHRRSRVLMDLREHHEVILERIRAVLPRVLEKLGIEEFPVTVVEAQITASNDGDFFHPHCDDAQEMIASRRVTFVYFFHREPRPFEGGELRLHDSPANSAGGYQSIVPQQNQIVFFPCSVLHEITPVECPSGAFADSRFTLNGWLHK